MRRAVLTMTLLLGLTTAATLAPALSVPAARAQAPVIVSFPWVPRGEMVGGQGPWYAELTLQNLTGEVCPLSIYVARNGTWAKTTQISMTKRSSRSISSSEINVPSPGGPVRAEAFCAFAASLKAYTPDLVSAPWSDGAHVVTGYTGIHTAEVAAARATATSSWVLPIVQTNSDWNTFVRVANLSSDPADVSIELYAAGNSDGAAGVFRTYVMRVAPASTWTFDLASALQIQGWVGFARIVATRDTAVIAQRTKASTTMALTNVAIAVDGAAVGEHRTVAPLLFNAYNGWNTGINLANPSDQPTDVQVHYYAAGGGNLGGVELTLPARSMQYIYTPGNVGVEGFVGSATIVSDTPVVGAVDEVKYETTEALSYMTGCKPQTDAAIPVVFREDPASGRNDNSGINIASLNREQEQTVQIDLVDNSGVSLLEEPLTVVIPAGGNAFVYLPFVDGLSAGLAASARLTTADPAGFVAISNDINYAVAGDGSVVFVATSTGGYYLVPRATGP